MASAEFEALRAQFATTVAEVGVQPVSLEEERAQSERFSDLATEPEGVSYAYDEVGGVRVLVHRPEGADDSRAIEYLHGGGFRKCSVESHRKLVGHIAKAAGAVVLSVDYRLTPEHRHPSQVDDAVAVYRALATSFGPHGLVVAGDSAGGGLALGTVLALKASGDPLPLAVIAISPWTDMSLSGSSIASRANTDVTTTVEYLRFLRDTYVTSDEWEDPRASPLAGDLAGLPPTYLMAGDAEILRDDAIRFGLKAAAAGVDVTFDIVPDMQHIFVKAVGRMPESDLGIARLGSYLRGIFASVAPGQDSPQPV